MRRRLRSEIPSLSNGCVRKLLAVSVKGEGVSQLRGSGRAWTPGLGGGGGGGLGTRLIMKSYKVMGTSQKFKIKVIIVLYKCIHKTN